MIEVSKHIFRFSRSLRYRSFALLWMGQTVSELGDGAFDIALAWEVLQLTGSAALMGLIMTVETMPRILFFLLGGVAADHFPRRLILLYSDIGRAMMVFLVVGIGVLRLVQIWHLIVLVFFFGVVKGFFRPAYQSISPQLVGKETLQSANSMLALSEQLGLLLGPTIGSALIATTGVFGAFAFNAFTFVFSALCFLALCFTPSVSQESIQKNVQSTDKPEQKTSSAGIITNIAEGFRYVGGSRWLWVSILVASLGNIGFLGPLVVVLPKLIHSMYRADVWLFGVITAAGGLGTIMGSILAGNFVRRCRGIIAYSAMLLSSVALMFFGFPLSQQLARFVLILADALVGFGVGAFGVIWMTVLQELVPGDKLGRVVSIDMLGSYSLMPVGYLLAGILADAAGPARVYIAAGVLNGMLALLALCVREIRDMD